jgi:uncharacterized protein (TIGR03905 family)
MFEYLTQEVCAKKIILDIKDNTIYSIKFISGCPGSLQGISRLVEGMSVDDAIIRLQGITCGRKSTSCPDQLSMALQSYKKYKHL